MTTGAVRLALCAVSAASCQIPRGCNGHETVERETARPAPRAAEGFVTIPDRTPEIATYPCVEQCHRDRKPDPTPRKLTEFHSLKKLEHGDSTFWCNYCHNEPNLDWLRLMDGRTVSLNESHRLCGQCHGDKRRDWQLGIHGLQSGSWSGDKVRRTCTACHDAHSPRRPNFQALPAPKFRRGAP